MSRKYIVSGVPYVINNVTGVQQPILYMDPLYRGAKLNNKKVDVIRNNIKVDPDSYDLYNIAYNVKTKRYYDSNDLGKIKFPKKFNPDYIKLPIGSVFERQYGKWVLVSSNGLEDDYDMHIDIKYINRAYDGGGIVINLDIKNIDGHEATDGNWYDLYRRVKDLSKYFKFGGQEFKNYKLKSMTARFNPLNGGKYDFRSINVENVNNQWEKFVDHGLDGVETVNDYSIWVSDGWAGAISITEYELDKSFIQVHMENPILIGAGDRTSIRSSYYFNTNIKTDDNSCLFGAIKLGLELPQQIKTMRKETGLVNAVISTDNIKHLEKFYKVNINVFSNDKTNDIIIKSKTKHIKTIDLLYDNDHVSLITGIKEKGLKEIKKKMDRKIKKKAKKEPIIYKRKLLVYDLETKFNKYLSNLLQAYSASWYVHDMNDKYEYNEETINKCNFVYGDECLKKLVDEILTAPLDVKYTIVGFNNARFDNFFLAEELRCRNIGMYIGYVQNSILNFTIATRHNVVDICKFVTMKLDDACDAFDTTPKKMKGFSHHEVQECFEQDKIDEWLEDNYDKLCEYNKTDVLSLLSLTLKLYDAVKSIDGTDLFKYVTKGQMGYKVCQDKLTAAYKVKFEYLFPRLSTKKIDDIVRSGLIGGRVQAYYGRISLRMQLKMVDVKSLYPFVMSMKSTNVCGKKIYFKYPIGKEIETEKYIEGKQGIYRCDIKHQNIDWKYGIPEFFKINPEYYRKYAPVIIPLRDPKRIKALDWEYRGEQKDVYLSEVSIESLKYHAGDDSVIVHEGIYWNKSIKGAFAPYINAYMEEKGRQDKLKKTDISKYNAAIRQYCKDMMNVVGGKLGQRNFDDLCVEFLTKADRIKFNDKTVPESRLFSMTSNGVVIASGKLLNDKDIFTNRAKPVHLCSYIYEHARNYMYECLLSRYCIFYQDTDSAMMPESEYIRLLGEQPQRFTAKELNKMGVRVSSNHGNGSVGELEEELGECESADILCAKSYRAFCSDTDHSKIRFKGISPRDVFYCEDEIEDISKLTYEEKEKLYMDRYNMESECGNVFKNNYYDDNMNMYEEQFIGSLFNKDVFDDKKVDMYDELMKGKKIYVLHSQLIRKGYSGHINEEGKIKSFQELNEMKLNKKYNCDRGFGIYQDIRIKTLSLEDIKI